tara:strand:+ start:178 stop:309 length:132 start_codon:yes stop_codon:yes gene_type:complete
VISPYDRENIFGAKNEQRVVFFLEINLLIFCPFGAKNEQGLKY